MGNRVGQGVSPQSFPGLGTLILLFPGVLSPL